MCICVYMLITSTILCMPRMYGVQHPFYMYLPQDTCVHTLGYTVTSLVLASVCVYYRHSIVAYWEISSQTLTFSTVFICPNTRAVYPEMLASMYVFIFHICFLLMNIATCLMTVDMLQYACSLFFLIISQDILTAGPNWMYWMLPYMVTQELNIH